MSASRVFVMILAGAASLAATAAGAQDVSHHEQETRSERMAIFGLPSANEVAASGAQAVRVFVDGAFSGWLPAMVLEKPANGAPRIEVISGRWDHHRWRRVTMSSPVSSATWTALFNDGRAAIADWEALEAERTRPKPPPPPGPPGAITELVVCADGQDSVVETIDSQGHIARAAEHDCEFRELGDFAAKLAAQALEALPDCASYSGRLMYGDQDRLAACAGATGDRRAALEAESAAFGPDRHDLPNLASEHVVVDWAGKPRAVGKPAFSRLWSQVSELPGLHFQAAAAAGLSRDRAVLTGSEIYLAQPDDNDYQRAESVQTWVKRGGAWRLARLRVGPFKPSELAHDPRKPT